MNKTDFLLKLKLQKGVGYIKTLKIASQLDTEEVDAFQLQHLGLPDSLQEISLRAFYDQKATTIIERIRKQCHVISFFDQVYLEKLRQIYQPPLILFGRGDFSLLNRAAVAIVGARMATKYSQVTIERLMPDLIKKDRVIVSGLADGVDSMAHQAALKNGGKTIAVVGNGLNHYYPSINQKIQDEIAAKGLLLSEYLPDTPPRPYRFPERNRIIAGLCESVIITEAKEKSGSLITASLALQENRNVYAVPGPITSSLSKGTNQLIEAGATPIIDFELPEERFDNYRRNILFSE